MGREELRSMGVDPDPQKKPGFATPAKPPWHLVSPAIEDELREWHLAKAAKDYHKADAIRSSLRSKGVEPEKHDKPSTSSSSMEDPMTLFSTFMAGMMAA